MITEASIINRYEWTIKHANLVVDARNAAAEVKDGRKRIVKT